MATRRTSTLKRTGDVVISRAPTAASPTLDWTSRPRWQAAICTRVPSAGRAPTWLRTWTPKATLLSAMPSASAGYLSFVVNEVREGRHLDLRQRFLVDDVGLADQTVQIKHPRDDAVRFIIAKGTGSVEGHRPARVVEERRRVWEEIDERRAGKAWRRAADAIPKGP